MPDHAQKVTGGCMCGAVRYVAPAPHSVIYCHCRDCRRHTGAPVVSFVGYPGSEIKWSGDARQIYKSSAKVGRGFCGKCGTPLTWEEAGEEPGEAPGGGEIEIYIGTTDNPDDHAPTLHIWHHERIKWLETTDRLPRYHRWAHDGSEPYLHGPAEGTSD